MVIKNLKELNSYNPDLENKVISLDVFDTLIIRKVEPPNKTKEIAAEYISRSNILELSPLKLIEIREEFEQELFSEAKHSGFDPVYSIEDLYEKILTYLNEPLSKIKQLINMELKVEKALVHPMPSIKLLLKKLAKNHKLIAVSDTYYPSWAMKELLGSCNLLPYIQNIYCSCDYKLSKATGRLYEVVLQKEQLQPVDMVHIGDNFTSDFIIPKDMGIKPILLYDDWNYERKYFMESLIKNENKSDFHKGYALLYSINSIDKYNEDEMYEWGKNVIGPLLVLYIHLLINETLKRGIKKIYFIAREGFILRKIYKLFTEKTRYSNLPSSRYLALSRYTSFISSIKDLNDNYILDLAIYGDSIRFKDILSRIGIDDLSIVNNFIQEHQLDISKPLNKEEARRVLKKLVQDANISKTILNNSKQLRIKLEKYLLESEFLNNEEVALVDVGWRGTIQYCIERTYSKHERFPKITGYHLGLEPLLECLDSNNSPEISGLVYDYRYSFPEDSNISISKGALEISTVPNHGATIGYEINKSNQMIPIFLENINEKHNYKYVNKIQKGIVDFTKEYLKLNDIYDLDPVALKPFIIKLYNNYLSNPSYKKLDIFKNLVKSIDFGTNSNNQFVSKFSIKDILNYKYIRRAILNNPWKEASIKNSRIPLLLLIYRIIIRITSWQKSKKFMSYEKITL